MPDIFEGYLKQLEHAPPYELGFVGAEAEWLKEARPKQILPINFSKALLLTGRGWGKNKTAASWCRRQAGMYPGSIGHVIAPTFADLHGTIFEGETGLIRVIPEAMRTDVKYSPYPFIRFTNGSTIRGFSAEKPDRLRGPQCHWLWGDEIAVWQHYDDMMNNIDFSTRLVYDRKDAKGAIIERIQPQRVFTTTPQPIEQLREMAEDPKVFQVRGSLYENKDNLAETFIEDILKHEGTKLGEQEIYGIILNFDDSAIIKKRWLRMWPKDRQLPQFQMVYVSFDTALTEETYNTKTRQADYTACTVWGVFLHEHRMNVMMLNAWHERLGFPDLIEKARQEMRTEYGYVEPIVFKTYAGKEPGQARLAIKPKLMIIEDKGSGISLRQTLDKEKVPMWPYNPGKASKLERLNSIAYTVKGGKTDGRGRVWLIEGENSNIAKPQFVDWSAPFLAEVCIYNGPGSTRDDDFVDSFSQAMRYFADQYISTPVSQKRMDPPPPKRPLRVNPYGG